MLLAGLYLTLGTSESYVNIPKPEGGLGPLMHRNVLLSKYVEMICIHSCV